MVANRIRPPTVTDEMLIEAGERLRAAKQHRDSVLLQLKAADEAELDAYLHLDYLHSCIHDEENERSMAGSNMQW